MKKIKVLLFAILLLVGLYLVFNFGRDIEKGNIRDLLHKYDIFEQCKLLQKYQYGK